MIKMVILNIFSNKNPFFVQVFSQNGILLATKFCNVSTKICFCTCDDFVLAVAKHKNQIQKKYVGLHNLHCQTQNINFNFSNNLIFQNFLLHDQNYGLPVNFATLNFFN